MTPYENVDHQELYEGCYHMGMARSYRLRRL